MEPKLADTTFKREETEKQSKRKTEELTEYSQESIKGSVQEIIENRKKDKPTVTDTEVT